MQSSALLKSNESAPRATRSTMGHVAAVRLPHEQLRAQAGALAACFPGVSTDFVDDNIRSWESSGLPDGATDIQPFLRRDILGHDYEQALTRVFEKLREKEIMKYRWGQEHYQFLRPEHRTIISLLEIERSQRGSIIFIPVNMAGRHLGATASDVRRRFAVHEFGLGAFEAACWLLSKRDSLPKRGLKLMCIGDTYKPGPGPDTNSVPTFSSEEHDPTSKGKIALSRRFLEEGDLSKKWFLMTGFMGA